MTAEEALVLHAFWKYMYDKELAGHFPFELLTAVDRTIHPVRCGECDGFNIQCAMMVNLNTQEIKEDFGSWEETDTKWCEDCEKHVLLVNPSGDDAPLWMNNEVQFARLICELVAAGLERKTNTYEVADSMDLSTDELESLFDRAEKVWEAAKDRQCGE